MQVSQSLCVCLSFSLNSELWGDWQHPVEFWTRLHAEEFGPHPDHHHSDECCGSPAGCRVRRAVLLRVRSHYKQEPLRSGELQLWAGGWSQTKKRKTQCTEILLRGMRNVGWTKETFAGQCWRNVLRTLLSRLSVILRMCRKRNWPLEGAVYRLYSQMMIVYCFFCSFVHLLLVMRPRQNDVSSHTVGYFFSTSPFFRAVHNWVFSVIVLVFAWRCVCSVGNSHFIPMVPLNVFLLPFYTWVPP